MHVIGITGTKGKTTTATMLAHILGSVGIPTGYIGTNGISYGSVERTTANTTPDPLTLQQTLADMQRCGIRAVVMEVSSQAMKLKRTAGILFDAALFLNLSPDHIGGAEHKDFDEYRSCKAMLFRQCRQAAGNVDDEHFQAIFEGCTAPITTFGFSDKAEIRAGSVTSLRGEGLLGSRFAVSVYDHPVLFNMPGRFNVSDALAAIAVAQLLSVPEEAVRRGLLSVRVRGRTEVFPHSGNFIVLIDYAHNDVSFASLLSTLRGYEHKRIIVVFGAGGDRPKMRRADMAREAAKYAHFAVITTDNPRSEPVEEICADITTALNGAIPSIEIYDRAQAIRYALDMAKAGDIVALLGKGHEEYIEVNGVRSHFSEREVLEEYFHS
jgi:UDP-N-acetylmuramoyl-L-alanyl-D-glutamate--2,6-diaminopimelate ligase